MLGNQPIVAFVATQDRARAKAFYVDLLGLALVEDGEYALVVEGHGTMVRIQIVPDFKPQPFTALGWQVPDIAAAVRALGAKGVVFERYGFMPQDELGVWASPSGARVAWFKDPDGQTLSLTQS